MKRVTIRQLEIMQGIAQGGILFQSGWHLFNFRKRDNGKRESHCSFQRASAVNSGHRLVTVGLADKMVNRGLMEPFKPHAGVPAYRLTPKGHEILERWSGGMGRYQGDTFKVPA